MMQGALRDRVELQRSTQAQGVDGAVTLLWSTYGTEWASIRTLTGVEQLNAESAERQITHKILIRYRDDVRQFHRIKWDSRILNIESALDLTNKRRELSITAKETIR